MSVDRVTSFDFEHMHACDAKSMCCRCAETCAYRHVPPARAVQGCIISKACTQQQQWIPDILKVDAVVPQQQPQHAPRSLQWHFVRNPGGLRNYCEKQKNVLLTPIIGKHVFQRVVHKRSLSMERNQAFYRISSSLLKSRVSRPTLASTSSVVHALESCCCATSREDASGLACC